MVFESLVRRAGFSSQPLNFGPDEQYLLNSLLRRRRAQQRSPLQRKPDTDHHVGKQMRLFSVKSPSAASGAELETRALQQAMLVALDNARA
jgi:hypothetical protein